MHEHKKFAWGGWLGGGEDIANGIKIWDITLKSGFANPIFFELTCQNLKTDELKKP